MKNSNRRWFAIPVIAGALGLMITGCQSDAGRVSQNLSTSADNFEVNRRVVFFNGITDKYLLSIEGNCAIFPDGGKLDVVCKIGPDEYKKHNLGLSDNVSYFVEQLDAADVSEFHYRVIFKPENVVPDIDLSTSNDPTK